MKRILLVTCLLTFNIALSQMTVIPNNDAEDLILNSLIGNPNFPASNFISSSGDNFGDVTSLGSFVYNGTDLPFNQGIVLSSGDILEIPGTNTNLISSGNSTWPGDVDLDMFFDGVPTNNASLLQFDFTAEVEMISLDFLMASEEYDGTFECAFADSFAFILTNTTTGISTNIALVPGTTTPIAVTTVHAGLSNQCEAINETYFDRYNFNVDDANIPSISAEDSSIDLNGQTEVFLLMGDLTIGDSYSVKIAIADALDNVLDSALFVRNSSFGAFPVIDQEPDNLIVEDTNDDGFETFDLTANESLMLGAVDTATYSFLFTYHLSQGDAEAGVNAISNPEVYTNTTDLQNIYVNMRNAYTGTQVVTNFKITINPELLSVDNLELDAIALYPNPVLDLLVINTNQLQIKSVDVYTINGQLITSQTNSDEDTISIDFSDFRSGMYLVKLTSEKGSVYKRILK